MSDITPKKKYPKNFTLTVYKNPDYQDLLGETVLQIQNLQRMNYAMGFAIKIYKLSNDPKKRN